ncbi:MAG: homoprotocatechuate degradation operon regulator HpaR [Planktomarina sp.]|nr:homoprotocatechuate degradation operon regulator HpaR [Planktomarina sp.]MDT2034045.1 homoprotocatechuate degradation operon regulator HpaR [Planktomarina sp.]MDT2050281.1 homoprotocatechuate degradation operon regulator HpaR [Planktomarina sp.]
MGLPPTRRSLPIALIRSREKVMGPIRDMLKTSGITEQQWRVLRVLSETGPQDLTQISDKASLLLPSLSRIIRKLLDGGLVVSSINSRDRRRQTVVITPEGQKIIDDNLPQATKIAEELQHHLGTERYEQLLDLLAALEN